MNQKPHPVAPTVTPPFQDWIAAAFGILPADRDATIKAMLERSGKESAGYWLQLLLAMGIASLGLVLGSTAVVIGAMLISPLMGPIVELGMGLAVGSPFLVMRSFARTGVSVVVVVVCAALLTVALPFHEVTTEIAGRTSPTALDLAIAICCAIAAAYTAVRPGSDTTGTAAGTAIGIALVPPLCVIGYGIGTSSRSISTGAALLFTANFVAILLFAILCFLLLGYNRVRAADLERAELDEHHAGGIRRVAHALQIVFASKYGPILRVLMPVMLLGVVYLPLREALVLVTWQVRVRATIQHMLGALPQNTVRSSISVDRHEVAVRLVTLGRAADAAKLETELREKIATAAGVVPKVSVIAVPDGSALQEMADRIKATSAPVEVVHKEPDVALLRDRFAEALHRSWPSQAGTLLRWRVELPEGAPVLIDMLHAGPALGPAGAALLGGEMTRALGTPIVVAERVVPLDPIVADAESGVTWLGAALPALDLVGDVDTLHGCIEVPATTRGRPAARELESIVATLQGTRAFLTGRVRMDRGRRFQLVVSTSSCPGEDDAADGGVDAGR